MPWLFWLCWSGGLAVLVVLKLSDRGVTSSWGKPESKERLLRGVWISCLKIYAKIYIHSYRQKLHMIVRSKHQFKKPYQLYLDIGVSRHESAVLARYRPRGHKKTLTTVVLVQITTICMRDSNTAPIGSCCRWYRTTTIINFTSASRWGWKIIYPFNVWAITLAGYLWVTGGGVWTTAVCCIHIKLK